MRRATSAARTRAFTPNWRRRTPPSSKARSEALGRAFIDQGITFSLSGQERPFPLDLVPRVISAAEWSRLERGITQRVKALEMYLDDIYGDQEILRDGVIPRRSDHVLRAFPPRGRRHRPAQRRAHPRRRHRPGPRRPGHLPGPRGQPALAVRGVLRHGEPAHDGAGLPESVRHPSGARGRRLLLAPAAGAAQLRGHQRGRPDGGGADPRRLQLRLLRAFAAGPPDGRRAGRGPRPVLPRQPGLHAHHRGRASGRRHLPAHRRRLPGPAAVPRRLGARGGRAGQRRPRRQRRHLQRGRQRCRRRQTRLHLCADRSSSTTCGEKPLLANVDTFRCWLDDEREEVLDRIRELVHQAGRRLRRLRHRVRPGSLGKGTGHDQQEDSRRSAQLDRPADGGTVDRADPDRTARWRPATSTCGRSRSTTATTCGCCRAG